MKAAGLIDHISSADLLHIAADPSSGACRARATKRCKHLGCRLAGIKAYAKVLRPPVYVVWATPTHPEKPWAVGREIRPGCLKVAVYVKSKRLADVLAKTLSNN